MKYIISKYSISGSSRQIKMEEVLNWGIVRNFTMGTGSFDEGARIWFSVYNKRQKFPKSGSSHSSRE